MLEWAIRVFGEDDDTPDTASPLERALRFIEEAAELVQAIGLTEEQAMHVIRHVYSKPVGERFQEFGGVMVTALALAESVETSLYDAEVAEVSRILAKSPEHFRRRQKEKREAGLELAP